MARNFISLPRTTGIFAGLAPTIADILGKLSDFDSAIDDFKATHGEKLDALTADVRDLNSRVETAKALGGGRFDATAGHEDRAALSAYLRNPIKAAMSTDNNPSGGYTLGKTLDSQIVQIATDAVVMRQLASVVTLAPGAGEYVRLVNKSGSTAEWVTERQTRAKTEGPNFAKIEPPEGELSALPRTTQRLLDDSAFDIASLIVEDIGKTFSQAEGAAYINGDGVGKPLGFLEVPTVANASHAWGKLGFLKTGDNAGFIAASSSASPADILVDLVYSLKAEYRRGGTWLMSSSTAAVVRKFKDAEGRYIWTDSLVVGQATLLGYPVAIDETMPAIAQDKFPVAFGDFRRGYLIVDRWGVRVMPDPYTDRPYVGFYATKRVGGCVQDFHAIKLLKISS